MALSACSGRGNHHDLYAALQTYGTPLTIEQADKLVETIVGRAKDNTGGVVQLNDSQAETIAVGFARGRIAPERWSDAAAFAIVMVQTSPNRFSESDQTDNYLRAADVMAAAFSDPSIAPGLLSGLLNGTQTRQVEQLASSGDEDAARKVLNSALQSFYKR